MKRCFSNTILFYHYLKLTNTLKHLTVVKELPVLCLRNNPPARGFCCLRQNLRASARGFCSTKPKGRGDCSYYNTTHVNCVKQENIWKGGFLLAKGVYRVLAKGVSYWLRGFCLHFLEHVLLFVGGAWGRVLLGHVLLGHVLLRVA